MFLIIFGFICGIALGLTGGGGSILAVPLLTYGVGLEFHSAVMISLLVVGFTAIFGLIVNYKQRDIDYIAAVIMIITGVIFAPIGSYISQGLSDKLLMLSFSILMILIGVWSLVKVKLMSGSEKSIYKNITPRFIVALLISGGIVGTLTGFFGVGGGF